MKRISKIPSRILGDLRIFQAVVGDLELTLSNYSPGWPDGYYIFRGVDPYQLEDSSFPMMVTAIEKKIREAEIRGASKAARVINQECGLELTDNGEYYIIRS